VKSARLFSGTNVAFHQTSSGLALTVAPADRTAPITTLVLELA